LREVATMKSTLTLLLVVLISGCGTLPEQYSASPARCLVQGVPVEGPKKKETFRHFMLGMLDPDDPTPVTPKRPAWITDLEIRSVDGGEVIWVRGHHLGDKVWLEPGSHTVSVMCRTTYPWGAIISGTDVKIETKAGYDCFLAASQLQVASDKPQVTITMKEKK
jgi:hypothetical protein